MDLFAGRWVSGGWHGYNTLQEPLLDALTIMHGKLDTDATLNLHGEGQSLTRLFGDSGIPIASACSGTDMNEDAQEAITELLARVYGIKLYWNTLWRCDRKRAAQKFLQSVHARAMLFTHAEDVASKDMVHDLETDRVQEVSKPIVMHAGIECDDYSLANHSRSEGAGCYKEGRGHSGVSGKAVVGIVAKHLPLVLIIENVPGMKMPGRTSTSDFAEVASDLKVFGYYVWDTLLDPKDYYFPQSRKRLYAVSTRISATMIDQTKEHFVKPPWAARMQRTIETFQSSESERFAIGRFLFDADSSEVQQHTASLEPRTQPCDRGCKDCKDQGEGRVEELALGGLLASGLRLAAE